MQEKSTIVNPLISDKTKIKILLDSSANQVEIFKNIKFVFLNKQELLKYSILCWEVPSHIKDSDYFDHLQSKVPGLDMMISEFIEMTESEIINLSDDDRIKKLISEFVGVGVGLKYASEILNVNPNKFRKIPPIYSGKYLDYSVTLNNKKYEIETKGTISDYFTSMKSDIIAKKINPVNNKVYLRFGTIAMMNSQTKCVIVDDPPIDNLELENNTSNTQLLNYTLLLSYILDSKYYNRFVKPILKGKIVKARINSSKFFGKYYFNDNLYLGEYFDYRLHKDGINDTFKFEIKEGKLFQRAVKTKIFVGLDAEVINMLNKKNIESLENYSSVEKYIKEEKVSKFLDKDGILIVKSQDGGDGQIEEIFTEDVVRSRMMLLKSYVNGEWHRCGAPCKSRGKVGKPCDIKTYRSHCHFHR